MAEDHQHQKPSVSTTQQKQQRQGLANINTTKINTFRRTYIMFLLCLVGTFHSIYNFRKHKSSNNNYNTSSIHNTDRTSIGHEEEQSRKYLFLIFCGGPSGKADLNAILETWGKRIQNVLIMSNTPNDVISVFEEQGEIDGTPRHHHHHHNWKWAIYNTTSLDGGGRRRPVESWKEIIRALNNTLQNDPRIQYVVRTDSDTWWNTDLLFNNHHKHFPHHLPPLPDPDQPYMMGQFHPLVDFRWVRKISGVAMNGQKQYSTIREDDGRNAYLTGGAGVVMTRTAVENLVSCSQNNRLPSNDGGSHDRRRSASDQEDIWSSRMAYSCNVTLKRHDGMYQSGRRFFAVPQSLSIHRAVGDGRNGYVHPRYYERILYGFQVWHCIKYWVLLLLALLLFFLLLQRKGRHNTSTSPLVCCRRSDQKQQYDH
jgi:hypothetical protein